MYKQILKYEQLSEHIINEHLDKNISNFEVEFVMKSIKNKKACGTDGIAGDLISDPPILGSVSVSVPIPIFFKVSVSVTKFYQYSFLIKLSNY